ncbi:MAG: M28 family peptidase [Dehalococcoidia bacterium]
MRRAFLTVFVVSVALAAIAVGAVVVGFGGEDATPAATASPSAPAAASKTPAATSAASPVPTLPSKPTPTPGVGGPTGTASGPAEHDGERALALVEELSKSPRVSGSAAEGYAAEYIADLYRSYGYTTELIQFEFEGDRFRAGAVTLAGKQIDALTLAGSPGGTVEAAPAYVGLADEAGIAGQDLTGKIAVADRGDLNFVVKYQNVKDAGAIGLVIVNNRAGSFSGNLTTAATFPVVGVAQEDGGAILDAAKSGAALRIEAPPTVGTTKAFNILARPSADGECAVLVGGHFDTVPSAPGANDNASGTANVLELARAAAADGLDEGLCFASFGAEESGLYGSKDLVASMQKAGKLPRYMINLDVTGIGDQVEVIGGGAIANDALSAARQLGIDAIPSQLPPNSGSDHQSFIDAGVATVFLTSGDFGTIHSPQDVAADVSADELDRIGDTAFALIKMLLAQVARG